MDQHTITASPAELQALSELLQRVPTTLSEKLFLDAVLSRWFRQQTEAARMLETSGTPAPPTSPPAASETPASDEGAHNDQPAG